MLFATGSYRDAWATAAAEAITPLAQALLEDMLPPSSSICDGGGETSFNFEFSPSDNTSKWDEMSENYEQYLFQVQMSHTDDNKNRTWSIRLSKAGNMYSYVGAFGEAVPPQYHEDAPWIDEVWQSVAVVPSKNVEPNKYFIHQAGAYQRDTPLDETPYFSPNIARHCADRQCSFATWGTQVHSPSSNA